MYITIIKMKQLFCFIATWLLVSTCFAVKLTLTSEEKNLLVKVRDNVKSAVSQQYMLEDSYLIGWLRVKKHSVNEASEAIRKAMEWRKKNRMDTILDEQEPWNDLLSLMPYRTDAIAKDGTPVLEAFTGNWDFRQFVIAGKGILYPVMHARIFEEIANKSRRVQNPSDNYGYHVVADMTGFSFRKQACVSCMPLNIELVTNFDAYYSKEIQSIYLLNSSRIFLTFFDLMKSFLSEHHQNLLKVRGFDRTEWAPELHQIIPKEQLLFIFGGAKH